MAGKYKEDTILPEVSIISGRVCFAMAQTDKQTDRQTDRQTDKQTDRQTDIAKSRLNQSEGLFSENH